MSKRLRGSGLGAMAAWADFRPMQGGTALRRLVLSACLGMGATASSVCARQQPPAQPPAQQAPVTQPQQPTVGVEGKTVRLLANVRDKHGKIVSDLSKDDFQLDEDGRPQTIADFAPQSDLPLRIGLLVDTAWSQRAALEDERRASYGFLDHLLREGKDLAFVIHFDHEVELLQDFTPSHPKLQTALQALQTGVSDAENGGNNGGGGQGGSGGGRGRRSRGGGNHLYDALFLAADELMSKEHGRKVVILLSDGVDHGSKETVGEAITAAQRADVIVYSILVKDEEEGFRRPGGFGVSGHGGYGGRGGGNRYPQEQRPDGKKILEQISTETGGQLLEASKKVPVDKIYEQIDQELRNQYLLAYTPDKVDDPGYHKIHLAAKRKDLIVQARDGYYSGN